ncbi:MAG TPA: hypothetical protein VMT32_01720 [Bryobacteraceae bacterium]|nr:hypothetical protein [Bryobacteraceae bacterium]
MAKLRQGRRIVALPLVPEAGKHSRKDARPGRLAYCRESRTGIRQGLPQNEGRDEDIKDLQTKLDQLK